MALRFNQNKIGRLTSEILLALERLEDLRRLSKKDFLSDPHKIASDKYNFIVAIEAMIDLCNHIIAKKGYRVPEDYADTFRILAERGAFDKSYTQTLIQMARFRNRLVHIYWDVDENELYHLIQTRLQDIRYFLKNLPNFLKANKLWDWDKISQSKLYKCRRSAIM